GRRPARASALRDGVRRGAGAARARLPAGGGGLAGAHSAGAVRAAENSTCRGSCVTLRRGGRRDAPARQRRPDPRARRRARVPAHGAGRAPGEDPPPRPRAGRGAATAGGGDGEAPRAEPQDVPARPALLSAYADSLIHTFEIEKARALGT